jgi:ATPase, P-type (transporting), HAD superfamily, subfamily IC
LFLQPGDEIIIEAYSLVPCDCYVSSGESEVDQSTVTGESLPIAKVTGNLLMSGTRNISGRLTAVIEKQHSDSTLSMIIQSMVEGTTHRSQIQDRIQYATGGFVTLILFLAAITSLFTWIRSERIPNTLQRINMTAHRAMTVLAAACPCALNLAVPAAIFSCLGKKTKYTVNGLGSQLTMSRCC